LASQKNLELAWRRITTGSNQQYKKFFRELYYTYEISLTENLRDLRERLSSQSWSPQSPERLYLPKPSGLQRPITLLYLEDQIVLQAFANLVAKKLYNKRKSLMLKYVFSNVLQDPDSIFFFRNWRITYALFQTRIRELFDSGLKWVADFDLAAFYDTISHDLLLRTAFPRLYNSDGVSWISSCLRKWSASRESTSLGHGLPQGPIASDFLAECFLLPIDKVLSDTTGYIRYVDDIRLFGQTEDQTREAVLKLEVQCRDRSLIPQMGKFAIKKATSVSDAMGMLPSISDPLDSDSSPTLKAKDALKYFKEAIGGKPQKILEKTRARFVLFRAEPSSELLRLVLVLLPRHPEHVDAFMNYLSHYPYRKSIRDMCLKTFAATPYDYVKGELLMVLARYLMVPYAFSASQKINLIDTAINIVRNKKASFHLRLGASKVLAFAEQVDGNNYTRFLSFQNSALLQALVSSDLPPTSFDNLGAARYFLGRTAFEPGLALAQKFLSYKKRPSDLGINEDSLHRQVKNTLFRLGIMTTRRQRIDPIGEILTKRYDAPLSTDWRSLFESEYTHVAGILSQANVIFLSGPSQWLALQNSFNHALFIALQSYLTRNHLPGVVRTTNRRGELIPFGVSLDRNNSFSRQYPDIADAFRDFNDRRNKLPFAHPYDTRTLSRNEHLKPQERNRLLAKLKIAYSQIAGLLS
jgi:Reverse transcriptase (RNA-dependent DNA polymerase)